MNENAKQWIEALRSRRYTQERYSLRHGDGFCCLGVACDLYSNATNNGHWVKIGGLYYFQINNSCQDPDPFSIDLPYEVMKWLNLASDFGNIHNSNSLSQMNDAGVPFEIVADLIESEPPGLFETI